MKLFHKNFTKVIILLLCYFSFNNGINAYFYNEQDKYEKVIKINTYHEKLSYFEKGEKKGEFIISSGNLENQTPTGRFRIMTKHERMYSISAKKWMPYWMEFYKGEYGIHALPENYIGETYKSEEDSLGIADAGGCIRLSKSDANTLYEWAELDTIVLIAYDKNEKFQIDTIQENIKISEEKQLSLRQKEKLNNILKNIIEKVENDNKNTSFDKMIFLYSFIIKLEKIPSSTSTEYFIDILNKKINFYLNAMD